MSSFHNQATPAQFERIFVNGPRYFILCKVFSVSASHYQSDDKAILIQKKDCSSVWIVKVTSSYRNLDISFSSYRNVGS